MIGSILCLMDESKAKAERDKAERDEDSREYTPSRPREFATTCTPVPVSIMPMPVSTLLDLVSCNSIEGLRVEGEKRRDDLAEIARALSLPV